VHIIEKMDVIEDDKQDEVVRVAHFIAAHSQPAHSMTAVCRSCIRARQGRDYLYLGTYCYLLVDNLEGDYSMTYTFD
jgi:hypothetical protein